LELEITGDVDSALVVDDDLVDGLQPAEVDEQPMRRDVLRGVPLVSFTYLPASVEGERGGIGGAVLGTGTSGRAPLGQRDVDLVGRLGGPQRAQACQEQDRKQKH
jgi:hypothetical protein